MVKMLVVAGMLYNFCAIVATDSQSGSPSTNSKPRSRANSLIQQEQEIQTQIIQESVTPPTRKLSKGKERSKSFTQMSKIFEEAQ